MQRTNPVLSSSFLDNGGGLSIPRNDFVSSQPTMAVETRVNGDVKQSVETSKKPPSRRRITQAQHLAKAMSNGSHHSFGGPNVLNGRTNTHRKPLLAQSLEKQQKMGVARFSPPLQTEQIIKMPIDSFEQKIQRADFKTTTSRPMVVSSHVMRDLDSRIESFVSESRQNNHEENMAEMQAITKTFSNLVLTDFLSVSVRHKLPQKIIARHIRRHFLKSRLRLSQKTQRLDKPRSPKQKVGYNIVNVRGLANMGGQSCFLNSVLQALASLPSFLAYIDRIVSLKDQQDLLNHVLNSDGESRGHMSFSECLLRNLVMLNGHNVHGGNKVDPREVLLRVGKVHSQFRPKRHGYGMSQIGTEQQDAQELLQALLSMVIADAQLDSKENTVVTGPMEEETRGEENVVKVPLDFSQELDHMEEDGGAESVMSLSSFLTRIDMEQEKVGKAKDDDIDVNVPINAGHHVSSKPVYTHDEAQHQTPREEKKQESYDLDDLKAQQNITPAKKPVEDFRQIQSPMPYSGSSSPIHKMLKSLSPMTPSPLSGWVGSTLQCSTCNHVRPIQNAPFLDIPIVPSSISAWQKSAGYYGGQSSVPVRFPSCRLDHCIHDFCAMERVQDVECKSCTIQRDIKSLEEEIFMLRGAVQTVLKRSKGQTNQVEAMNRDLLEAEHRYAKLLRSDPDDWDETEDSASSEDDLLLSSLMSGNELLNGESKRNGKNLVRGDAKKCLLLTRMPHVLCLHVQRRYYNPATNSMSKALQHVDFPEYLDMGVHCAYSSSGGTPTSSQRVTGRTNGVDSPSTGDSNRGEKRQQEHKPIYYKLQSIIEHVGNAHAGHYQTYRRCPSRTDRDGGWVLVSDLHVTPLHWRDVRKCQAYMLFYEAM